jgi:small conductance mechanosensitive channel
LLNIIMLSQDPTNFLFLQNSINLLYEIFPKLFWAALTLLLTRWGAKLGRYFGQQLLQRFEPTLQRFLLQAIGIVIWLAGSVAALSAIGFDTTSLVAVIGASGLALGLALQNSLSHLAAGILLISFRTFEVGDAIEGGGVSGTVESIGLFATAVISADNTRMTIPNGSLFSGTLKNFTVMGTRRVDLKINIGDRPVQATIAQLMAIAVSHPAVLIDPAPTCVVQMLRQPGPEAILCLRPWCRSGDYDRVKADLLQVVQILLVTR